MDELFWDDTFDLQVKELVGKVFLVGCPFIFSGELMVTDLLIGQLKHDQGLSHISQPPAGRNTGILTQYLKLQVHDCLMLSTTDTFLLLYPFFFFFFLSHYYKIHADSFGFIRPGFQISASTSMTLRMMGFILWCLQS